MMNNKKGENAIPIATIHGQVTRLRYMYMAIHEITGGKIYGSVLTFCL